MVNHHVINQSKIPNLDQIYGTSEKNSTFFSKTKYKYIGPLPPPNLSFASPAPAKLMRSYALLRVPRYIAPDSEIYELRGKEKSARTGSFFLSYSFRSFAFIFIIPQAFSNWISICARWIFGKKRADDSDGNTGAKRKIFFPGLHYLFHLDRLAFFFFQFEFQKGEK